MSGNSVVQGNQLFRTPDQYNKSLVLMIKIKLIYVLQNLDLKFMTFLKGKYFLIIYYLHVLSVLQM